MKWSISLPYEIFADWGGVIISGVANHRDVLAIPYCVINMSKSKFSGATYFSIVCEPDACECASYILINIDYVGENLCLYQVYMSEEFLSFCGDNEGLAGWYTRIKPNSKIQSDRFVATNHIENSVPHGMIESNICDGLLFSEYAYIDTEMILSELREMASINIKSWPARLSNDKDWHFIEII